MSLLLDPRLFNWLIVGMFCIAAVRWACAGNMPQTIYWIAAAVLNVAVVMMAK